MDNQSNASLEIISRPVPKWVIDRIEDGWAVLDNSDTLESISLPLALLPDGIQPGDTMVRKNSKWYKDDAETSARKKRISERFAKIKAANMRE